MATSIQIIQRTLVNRFTTDDQVQVRRILDLADASIVWEQLYMRNFDDEVRYEVCGEEWQPLVELDGSPNEYAMELEEAFLLLRSQGQTR